MRGALEHGFGGGRYRFERSLEPSDDATIIGATRVGLPLASILATEVTHANERPPELLPRPGPEPDLAPPSAAPPATTVTSPPSPAPST